MRPLAPLVRRVRAVGNALRRRSVRLALLFVVAYVAGLASLALFFGRGGGQPTRVEFGLLVFTLAAYLYYAAIASFG